MGGERGWARKTVRSSPFIRTFPRDETIYALKAKLAWSKNSGISWLKFNVLTVLVALFLFYCLLKLLSTTTWNDMARNVEEISSRDDWSNYPAGRLIGQQQPLSVSAPKRCALASLIRRIGNLSRKKVPSTSLAPKKLD